MMSFHKIFRRFVVGTLSPILIVNYAFAKDTFLHPMSDSELSNISGQALMSMSLIAPNDSANKMKGQGIGFYRIGMEAEVEINTNIAKLQLGCGGENGAGGCDIDIDHLSLSGISDNRAGRASSSAKITNPFFEFAIKNPNSASTRQILGLRLSAEKLVGLLTMGRENSDKPNGLSYFSGYMKVQSGIGNTAEDRSKVKGYASTKPAYMDLSTNSISGVLNALNLANASFITTGGGFNIPAMNNLPFETDQIVINGNSNKIVKLKSSVKIPSIYLGNFKSAGEIESDSNGTTISVSTRGSPVGAEVTGCANVFRLLPACALAWKGREFPNITMNGEISGATAAVTLNEALGFIHKLEINSAAALSVQSVNMVWPGSDNENVAKPGWWLSLADPVNIGRVQPTERLSIDPLLPQFASLAGDALKANPARTSSIEAMFDPKEVLAVQLGVINLSKSPPLNMELSNLQLNSQNFAANCFGSLLAC